MSNENFLDIPKTDETQHPTPEEWIMVSDMSDMHVRRAFKRLLRMIRLNQLIDISDANKDTFRKAEVLNEVNNIISHCETIKEKIEDN